MFFSFFMSLEGWVTEKAFVEQVKKLPPENPASPTLMWWLKEIVDSAKVWRTGAASAQAI